MPCEHNHGAGIMAEDPMHEQLSHQILHQIYKSGYAFLLINVKNRVEDQRGPWEGLFCLFQLVDL